jgi:hypothetical protein
MTFNKLGEHIPALQYIDVIVRSSHIEESMPNPHIMICNGLKYHTTSSFMEIIHSFPRKWTVFHAQCMQSMLPTILENPVASFCARILAFSSALSWIDEPSTR